jgi:hypothetical protein
MNLPTQDKLLRWTGAIWLLTLFGLGDTAVIAWSSAWLNLEQIAAAGSAFVMMGAGLLVSVWGLRRIS